MREPADGRSGTSDIGAQPLPAEYLSLLRSLSGPERLRRALELTALARDLTWAGAVRHAGHRGEAAVLDRFLRQFHGDEVARALSLMPSRPDG